MITRSSVTGPLSLGQILDRAFRLYRARPGALLLTAAVVYAPYGLLQGVTLGPLMSDVLNASGTADAEGAGRSLALVGLTFLLMPLFVLGYTLVVQALACQVFGLLGGEELTVGQAYRMAFDRFISYFGCLFVQGLALAGITVPIYCCGVLVLAFGLAGLGATSSGNAAESVLQFAGLMVGIVVLLLAIVGPYEVLLSRWIAAMPAIADQRLGSLEALRRSRALTHGLGWRSLGFQILLQVMGLFFSLILFLPVQLLLTSLLPERLGQIVSTSIGTLPQILWQPLATAAVVMYYIDLRVRRENLDLAARVGQLEADAGPAAAGLLPPVPLPSPWAPSSEPSSPSAWAPSTEPPSSPPWEPSPSSTPPSPEPDSPSPWEPPDEPPSTAPWEPPSDLPPLLPEDPNSSPDDAGEEGLGPRPDQPPEDPDSRP